MNSCSSISLCRQHQQLFTQRIGRFCSAVLTNRITNATKSSNRKTRTTKQVSKKHNTNTHSHAYARAHSHTHTHVHTHTHARRHAHTHTRAQARTHTRTHAYTHRHAHLNACTHTHIFTHTHTHSPSLCFLLLFLNWSNKITDSTSDQLLISSPVYADHNRKILEITN